VTYQSRTQSAQSATPTLKKGDRVRVTYEGTIAWLGTHGTFGLEGTQEGHYPDDPTRVSIEKLADPEPEWVNGDVVKIGGWLPGHWFNGSWRSAGGGRHPFDGGGGSAARFSNYWQAGEVEILYKQDAERGGETSGLDRGEVA
jgi:hypothetical protein